MLVEAELTSHAPADPSGTDPSACCGGREADKRDAAQTAPASSPPAAEAERPGSQ